MSSNFGQRINSIDVMRGLVILIMLLDHVRERFYLHMQVSDPMNIDTTESLLFWSRFLAHFCAPIFVFLTGLSAYLYSQAKTAQPRNVSAFLIKRGLFLVALEVTVICFSWLGSWQTIYLQVIWAIGLSMLSLALFIKLPKTVLAILGLSIVFGHNMLTPITFAPDEWGYGLWTILHDRGYLVSNAAIKIKVSYPVLPWIGVIILGYLAGPLYRKALSVTERHNKLLLLGLASLSTFILLRGFNLYGETIDWQTQPSLNKTLMDIFNLTKYPPSLNFLLITLAAMFFALWLFEKYPLKIYRYLSTFGSVPMFFYIVHLYGLLALYTLAETLFGKTKGSYFGVDNMLWIWLITALLSIALYFPTAMFSRYKKAHNKAWLKYL